MCNFILEDGNYQISGIDIEDLVVALYVFCHEQIKCKNISFSLDPVDPKNPMGPFMKKVCWPDSVEGFNILAGTKFADIMFEADWIMK